MGIAQNLYHWLDAFWLFPALFLMEKGKKLLTCLFILSCVLLLRLQLELMNSIGFPRGVLGWVSMGLYERGLVVYGLFTAFFLLIAYFSKGSAKSIHMAASITILITAFCLSSLVMAL